MRKYAVIVAGGSGSRMGGGIPKQFRTLCGKPVLWWSMKAFHDQDPDTKLIVVLPQEFIEHWSDLYNTLPKADQFDHSITSGGVSRSESVTNGLALVDTEDSLVAIHDGARPLIDVSIIAKGWEEAGRNGGAIPVVAVTDSLRKLTSNGSESVNRSEYVAVQTPQVFKTSLLKAAYDKSEGQIFTDDAAVMENAGNTVSLFEGSPDNIKITNPKDLAIAAVIMGEDG